MSTTRELTLHVGLPKTATTTLQTHVLPRHPGYCGKWYSEDPERNWTTERQLFAAAMLSWRNRSKGWRRDLGLWVATLEADSRPSILISEEWLSSWKVGASSWPFEGESAARQEGRPPLAEFLGALRTELGDHWNVRVILAVRNQSDFIGSIYAQLNPLSAGQEHFEASVKQALKNSGAFFDWALLVDAVASELSTENLLVLVHEDGLEPNIDRIEKFLACNLSSEVEKVPRENVKTVGQKSWKTVPRTKSVTRRGVLGLTRRAIGRRWPQSLHPAGVALRRMLRSVDSAAATVFREQTPEGVTVSIPDALSAEIRTRFAASNYRLGRILSRDLTLLGY